MGRLLPRRCSRTRAAPARPIPAKALVQRQIPTFLQDLPDYQVLLVRRRERGVSAPTSHGAHGSRVPVAGTAGLTAGSWHPSSEQWGGRADAVALPEGDRPTHAGQGHAGLDRRARHRRSGGAHAFRRSGDPRRLYQGARLHRCRLQGPEADVSATGDWQLRQPILLATPDSLVSASPQEGYLHQVLRNSDTLGTDKPETACNFDK